MCSKRHALFVRPSTSGRMTSGYDLLWSYSFTQGIGFKETGRLCEVEGCQGKLKDELLDWEDALPDDALEAAEEHCKRADLALCLGTSLRVTVSLLVHPLIL